MAIKYVKHNQIDKTKWDYCIENSINGLIYGLSWYLDIVCEKWDALISDDYEAVMPLPWKSKMGVKYIYHPFFAQQLGVFYQKQADDQVFEFLQKIPKGFIKYETSINYLNQVKQSSLNIRTNHILNLNKPYTEIYTSFSKNTKRNIKKTERNNIKVKDNISVGQFLKLKKENNISNLEEFHFKILSRLFELLVDKKQSRIIGVTDADGCLLAGAIFVEYKKRIIYLFSASNEEGKANSAMFAIVNKVIIDFSETDKLLDFEGSMIDGIARFFKGFGAISENYYRIKKSRIPFIK